MATRRRAKSTTRVQRIKKAGTKRIKKLSGQLKKTKRSLLKGFKKGKKAVAKSLRQKSKNRKAAVRDKKKRATAERRRIRKEQQAKIRTEIFGSADISKAKISQASEDPGASRPGEPPKMRTGKGRDSIKAQLVRKGKTITARVYVDKKIAGYMAMWEFRQDGKARPFLKPGVMNNLGIFGAVIGTELKSSAMAMPKKKAKVR